MKNRELIIGFLTFVLSAFIFCSCSRNDQDEEMVLPEANIEITSPVENSVVRLGDTLFIKGTSTSIQEMHGYEIGIRKPGASNLFFQHYHGHGNTITIDESWKNTLNETADMEVLISVILDHEQHKQTKTVRFKINNQ
jgi:hypothetical protein